MFDFYYKKTDAEKKTFKRQMFAMIAGNIIMGLAMAMFRLSLFGNDPLSCMNLGYAKLTGFMFGACVSITNCFLLIPVWFLKREYIKPATFFNMYGLGFICDGWYFFLAHCLGTTEPEIIARSLLLTIGILVSCFGISLYMCSKTGMGPYDCYPWIVEQRTHGKIKFQTARICIDFICVVIGFFCGSIVGIGTLFLALGTGPIVAFFNNRFSLKYIYGPDNHVTI